MTADDAAPDVSAEGRRLIDRFRRLAYRHGQRGDRQERLDASDRALSAHIAALEAENARLRGLVRDPEHSLICPQCGAERSFLPACMMDICPMLDMEGKPVSMEATRAAQRTPTTGAPDGTA